MLWFASITTLTTRQKGRGLRRLSLQKFLAAECVRLRQKISLVAGGEAEPPTFENYGEHERPPFGGLIGNSSVWYKSFFFNWLLWGWI